MGIRRDPSSRVLHGRQVGRGVELGPWETGVLAVSGSDAAPRLALWSATRKAESRRERVVPVDRALFVTPDGRHIRCPGGA